VVCISICLKSVLRYNYLSLDICIPGTIYIYIYIYIRDRGREDPLLFFEAKRGPRAKTFAKHCICYEWLLFVVIFDTVHVYLIQ